MGKNGIPDRWLNYSNHGKVIEGTRIVALKVPLKQGLLNKVDAKERFSPEMATDGIPKLEFVVDLTYTTRYYSPAEFQSRGVGHSKIATEGHVIPSGAVLRRFFDTMDSYLTDKRRTGVIGVHCTHGVNRTGYMVCRYMISRLGFTADQAIAAFNKARGHDLERANYLGDLRSGNWPALPEAVEEPEEAPPELARERDGEWRQDRRDHWGPSDHRRRWREERRRLAGPYRWPPPPPLPGGRWPGGPGQRFWRPPPPPWAHPDWRCRGPPPLPPWLRRDGGGDWRHGPPPPPNGCHPPADELPPASDELPPPADELSLASDELLPAADELSAAASESSQDTDDLPRPAADGSPPATTDARPEVEELPPGRNGCHPADNATRPVTRLLRPVTEPCRVVTEEVAPVTEVTTPAGDESSPVTAEPRPGTGGPRPAVTGGGGAMTDDIGPVTGDARRQTDRQRAADAGWCWGGSR